MAAKIAYPPSKRGSTGGDEDSRKRQRSLNADVSEPTKVRIYRLKLPTITVMFLSKAPKLNYLGRSLHLSLNFAFIFHCPMIKHCLPVQSPDVSCDKHDIERKCLFVLPVLKFDSVFTENKLNTEALKHRK